MMQEKPDKVAAFANIHRIVGVVVKASAAASLGDHIIGMAQLIA